MTSTGRERGGADAAAMKETLRTAAEMLAECRRMLSAVARAAAQYMVTHALHRAAEGAAKALARRADGAMMRMAQCENAMRWMRDALADADEPQALKPYSLDEYEEADTLNVATLTSGKEVTA